MDGWYDANGFTPHIICEVELEGGLKFSARFVMGNWETLQGEVIYPVRFKPLSIMVDRALYGFTLPDEGES
jgi:hypothetical protein